MSQLTLFGSEIVNLPYGKMVTWCTIVNVNNELCQELRYHLMMLFSWTSTIFGAKLITSIASGAFNYDFKFPICIQWCQTFTERFHRKLTLFLVEHRTPFPNFELFIKKLGLIFGIGDLKIAQALNAP